MTLADFLVRLPHAAIPRHSGDGYSALCPAHPDHERSLSVTERDDKILVRCFKGCRVEAVIAAMGLRMADLFTAPPTSGPGRDQARHLVATYDYRAPDGTLLYQNVRYEPKAFRLRRPDDRGGWIWSLGDVRRVLYRLPELAEQLVVYLVEGEKDADRLWSLGLPATTAAAGAESWRAEYAVQLVEAGVSDVVLIPDNDQPGMKYMRTVAESLRQVHVRTVTIRLPGLPPVTSSHGGDISDWLDAGHTLDELAGVVHASRASRDSKLPMPLPQLFAHPPQEPVWLVKHILRAHANGWIGAGAKVGKSFLALDLLLACALGKPWLNQFDVAQPLTVVLIEEEDDAWRIYQRTARLCRGCGVDPPASFYVSIRSGYRLDSEELLSPLEEWLYSVHPDLIVWDVFNRLHAKDERKPDQIMPVLWRLDRLRNELGCSNLLAHHSRKPGPTGPDLAVGGQRLRGPSEFWGWAENSIYLSQLKTKGAILVEPESKDAIVEPFRAHLEDVDTDRRRWIYDGPVRTSLERGHLSRQKILEALAQPMTAAQLSLAVGITERTVKAHLRTLHAEGLVDSFREPGTSGRRMWMLQADHETVSD